MLFARVAGKKPLISEKTGIRLSEEPLVLDYTVEEMATQVEFDLPVQQEMKSKLENERVLLKQLLANIERNRVKWRKDIFEGD